MQYDDVIQAEVRTEGPEETEIGGQEAVQYSSYLVDADTGRAIGAIEIKKRFQQLKIVGVHLKPAGRQAMEDIKKQGLPGFTQLVGVKENDKTGEAVAIIRDGDELIHMSRDRFFKLYKLD